MKIAKSLLDLIGKTPLLELTNFEGIHKIDAHIIAKLESFNPAGSSKDRVGICMIETAESQKLLKPGSTIIEPTSGNTGIGLACAAVTKGYKVILTMPDTMSAERINLLKAYGAKVVLTDGKLGMQGAIDKANELADSISNSFIPSQFSNPANAKAHRLTTGPEIWEDTDGKVDVLIAGIGTGGTITGTGEYLKSMNPNIKVIGVEPASSPVLTKGVSGPHKIQGIGAGFVPEVLNTSICDEVIAVDDDAAYKTGRDIVAAEGLLVGISSGAAVWAAVELSKRAEYKDKNIVVILPDTGERYLSVPNYLV